MGYTIFMGLCVGTFKALSDFKEEQSIDRASEEEPRAVQHGTKAKGAVNSTSSGAREKQSGMTRERRPLINITYRLWIQGLVIPDSSPAKRIN
jgi:hypothetical protein